MVAFRPTRWRVAARALRQWDSHTDSRPAAYRQRLRCWVSDRDVCARGQQGEDQTESPDRLQGAERAMYRHILVAVDGSDISTRALQEALRLAKDEQAQVRLARETLVAGEGTARPGGGRGHGQELLVRLWGANVNRRTVEHAEQASLAIERVEDLWRQVVKLIVARPGK